MIDAFLIDFQKSHVKEGEFNLPEVTELKVGDLFSVKSATSSFIFEMNFSELEETKRIFNNNFYHCVKRVFNNFKYGHIYPHPIVDDDYVKFTTTLKSTKSVFHVGNMTLMMEEIQESDTTTRIRLTFKAFHQ